MEPDCRRNNRGQGQQAKENERGPEHGRGAGERGASGKTLNILYTNCQSIVGKIDELSSIASETQPHLILLNETWCNSQISDAYLGIPGYELQMRIDREDTGGGRGGGILIYGKTGLSLEPIDAKTSFS